MRPTMLLLTAVTVIAACTVGDAPTSPSAGPTSEGPAATASATSPAPRADPSGPVTDPRGDVADPEGNPPGDPVPAADLVGVEVDVTADEVLVRFHVAGPPPSEVGSLLWSVRTQRGGEPVLTISAQQVGPEVFGAVYSWADGGQQQLEVDIDGPTVVVRVARNSVDDLGSSWSALVQLDGAYEDSTPLVPLSR